MNERKVAFLKIHIAVLLFGLTGILGALISLEAINLVWWRMGLTSLSFLLLPGLIGRIRQIPSKYILRLAGIGALVALHWVTFFASIHATNASVALAVLATQVFFTSLIEPVILKRKAKWYEMALGILVVPGVALVNNSTDFGFWGIALALISAVLAATFSVLNKKMVDRFDPKAITFIELGSGWILLCIIVPFMHLMDPSQAFLPTTDDIIYLSVLAFLCTTLAFVISLQALKVLTPFTVNLTVNLEPIYTIIIAAFLLKDAQEMNAGFYVGAMIIILSVFAHPILDKYFGKNRVKPITRN